MGCHTWFYKKVYPNPTYDEIRDNVYYEYVTYMLDFYNRFLNNKFSRLEKMIFYDLSKDDVLKSIEFTNRMGRMIQSNLCKVAVCKRYIHKNGKNKYMTKYVENKGFYYYDDNDAPHDLFRIDGYPEDKLYSYNDTINFINKNIYNVEFVGKDWNKKLKHFWEINPDGMICFG